MTLKALNLDERARVDAFIALRAKWAATHNLSGPDALRDPWGVDVIDALALASVALEAVPLIDVGSGSGVPGLVYALLWPERRVVLVEPLAKRSAFLRSAAITLGLSNVQVERQRWPLAALPGECQVVSRAVYPVPEWPRAAALGDGAVTNIIRYLAAERPEFNVPGFCSAASLDYAGPGGAQRRIERWSRSA